MREIKGTKGSAFISEKERTELMKRFDPKRFKFNEPTEIWFNTTRCILCIESNHNCDTCKLYSAYGKDYGCLELLKKATGRWAALPIELAHEVTCPREDWKIGLENLKKAYKYFKELPKAKKGEEKK